MNLSMNSRPRVPAGSSSHELVQASGYVAYSCGVNSKSHNPSGPVDGHVVDGDAVSQVGQQRCREWWAIFSLAMTGTRSVVHDVSWFEVRAMTRQALPAAGRRSGIPSAHRAQHLERVPADPFGHQRTTRDN